MQAAVIVMSILGCNGEALECRHLATVQKRYPSIELCEIEAETVLERNATYRVATLVAVCETPDVYAAQGQGHGGEATAKQGRIAARKILIPDNLTLAERAVDSLRDSVPSMDTIRTTLEKPGEMVSGTYDWIARQFK